MNFDGGLKPRFRIRWAKEEITDALTAWLAERVQQLDVRDEPDDERELRRQVERVRKYLQITTPSRSR